MVLLTVAALVGAVIGIRISHDDTAHQVAADIGCVHLSAPRPIGSGPTARTCSYQGDRTLIITLREGRNAMEQPHFPGGFILVPGRAVIVGCAHAEDCVEIHRILGGVLTPPGPALGVSITVD